MNTAEFLNHIREQKGYNGQIAYVRTIPETKARHAETEKPLSEVVRDKLENAALLPLYSHQAQAVNHAMCGKNVMVATSSASGKTLCYNIPVMEEMAASKVATALYLYPAKALAQDQLRGINRLFAPEVLEKYEIGIYDGDTPYAERGQVRKQARLILSNPDMLHYGILPNHKVWSRFLRNLKYVVVDEAHVYKGVFGSNVANVLRRLRRVCGLYGANPQFICSSATISESARLAENLTGLPFELVDDDGSPHGEKEFVFWNPPIIDDKMGTRRSANTEASSLLTELISEGIRTLVFAKSRKLTELIYTYSRDALKKISAPLASKIMPYRAGYLPKDRRKIEKDLFEGKLLGAVATNALELGIDIGGLDATILTGYPGSIASTYQQAGRSGRRGHSSLSFLIGLDNPLDQFLMRNPSFLFEKNAEEAIIDAENEYILYSHLVTAAWEHPLTEYDSKFFGGDFALKLEELERRGFIRKKGLRWYLTPDITDPSREINIRSASGQPYRLIDEATEEVIETVEEDTAFFMVHPGAVYLHQGETYLVTKLDIEAHVAYLSKEKLDYYTQVNDLTDIKVKKVLKHKKAGSVSIFLGEVDVTIYVPSYKKKSQTTESIISHEPLDLPPMSFHTIAVWFDAPPKALCELADKSLDVQGGLHALEHALIGILPVFASCDRNDIGGVSTTMHPDTGGAAVFIYDAHPGGVGIAKKGYEIIGKLWSATLDVIKACPCAEGCPSCIHSPKCGNNNEPLDKKAALVLLERTLSGGGV